MNRTIRIGTRESKLALWQAHKIQGLLEELGLQTEVVKIKSKGDIVLDRPLYEIGVTGIFTKTLDIALLNGEIDIAVHSMKDVPTLLPEGIEAWAVPERGNAKDLVVHKHSSDKFLGLDERVIATGSLRRTAQWLHKYPEDRTTDLRGNVITRLEKLNNNNWQGAIFAAAGLERINILPENHIVLDWMTPAPAQGALLVVGKKEDRELGEIVKRLNHTESANAVRVERDFMRTLEGGCTAPIGAFAEFKNGQYQFTGVLHSLDGKEEFRVEKSFLETEIEVGGKLAAKEILNSGGTELMKRIKKQLS